MKLICINYLIHALLILYDAGDYDVIIKAGETKIQNISCILRARSPSFKDEVKLTEQPCEDILKLLIVSNELLLEELV
ncbi:uncharacterized protein OCT59_005942 [Rhizophagus irregularis]|uniref:BTB domain-containing protein n=1 Tax=Rhizophagus irregularis (strain DAOM 181602 / DAOM 197198 / MUCL 43194) TaxID=747089 RepID=A0A2P4QHC0_RHIID|nr:hypothetical protein GLOIN_2v1768262 [Rhizophagus irregularis DAOM 181602=DAOM 197198]POG77006.1 hypothetical protein GLOIN_2v1768262 [Rhizophagus irregularis DAOM 181602=DAOM 197198]UZO14485.1 hypothetical protein OCT59_005942 [Rhizophagus irregularis]GET64084.1 hypothetical protein GLOIN_2v1768262 [Rhizophagus irregularis DAOM 181602=DAOM 197198]|eukprot:XP_025183872.1 hypothetical protein GLOIN_2v1768262 [Rhizophagus irregularis DAOM 181602=DAOM 197198]